MEQIPVRKYILQFFIVPGCVCDPVAAIKHEGQYEDRDPVIFEKEVTCLGTNPGLIFISFL